MRRLRKEISETSREDPFPEIVSSPSVIGSSATTPLPSAASNSVVSIPFYDTRAEDFILSVPLSTLNVRFIFRIDEIRNRTIHKSGVTRQSFLRYNAPGSISGKWWICCGSGIHEITELPAAFSDVHFDTNSVCYSSGTFSVAQGGKTTSLHCRTCPCIVG